MDDAQCADGVAKTRIERGTCFPQSRRECRPPACGISAAFVIQVFGIKARTKQSNPPATSPQENIGWPVACRTT